MKPTPLFNASSFAWTKLHGVTEASTVSMTYLGRVYDDTADIGFSMRSDRTGEIVVFALTETKRNDDDDITGWEFVCVSKDAPAMTVSIFND